MLLLTASTVNENLSKVKYWSKGHLFWCRHATSDSFSPPLNIYFYNMLINRGLQNQVAGEFYFAVTCLDTQKVSFYDNN